ncbi:MAG: hypothetical protein QCH31_11995 [Methanolobus sp.]|nr:hypothetical protein [Methanolobus sp.]
MSYYGLQKPANDVIMGQPVPTEYLKAENTSVKPGLLVKKGTTQDLIVACDAAGNPGGWAGYGAAATLKPEKPATAYKANDMVPVHNGGGFHVVAILAETETVGKNDPLVAADNGEVKALDTAAPTPVVGYAAQDANATAGATAILVRSII